MTASASSAVEAATFTALSAGLTLAPVFQHVPEDQALPLVVIARIRSESDPWATKDDRADRQITLTIQSVIKGEERAPLLAIEAEVFAALDGLKTQVSGWLLEFEHADDDGDLLDDGVTYVSTSTFTVNALKAN